ncbi:MAG: type II toxin-antitoxin system HicB family antitoxin [Dehalococcoidia bacterium]|nr:type II toxin-antitoxin system HicB family antitoxin [Dehalococcoidia bacterium]
MTSFTVLLSREPESGRYTAVCPSMPGCITEGSDFMDAVSRVTDAMDTWLDVAHGEGLLPTRETPDLIDHAARELQYDRYEEGLTGDVEQMRIERDVAVPETITIQGEQGFLVMPADEDDLTLLTIRAVVRAMGASFEDFVAAVAEDEDEE